MSKPDLSLAPYACDIIEIVALQGAHASVQAALDRDALHIAPGRWWVRSTAAGAEAMIGALSVPLACKAVLIDQSSGFAGFRISGTHVREALARVCRLDLHDRTFPAGHATRTIIAQIPALVYRPHLPDTFDVHVPTTFGQTFTAHLIRATHTFQPIVDPALKAVSA